MSNRIVKTSDIQSNHAGMKRVLQGTGELDQQSMNILTRATPAHIPEAKPMTSKRKRGRPRKNQSTY